MLHQRSSLPHRFPRWSMAVCALGATASAAAQQAPRSVLPIREVVIRPVGTPRYAVTIIVNGVPIETGLDTGSVGLRILPRAARRAGIVAGPQLVRYSYGGGVELDGGRATVDLTIGAVRGQVPVQSVDRVSCVDGGDCPAAKVPPAAYGFMGSGQPGQGFQAIMGTRLNSGVIPNPLTKMGVRRWIVHLPPRGGGGGALILNPDERDVAGFVLLRSGMGTPGTVAGCIMVARPGARHFCGPTLLDTGAPEIVVRGATRPVGWQPGVPARLALPGATNNQVVGVVFPAGDEAHGGKASFRAGQGNSVSLTGGVLPFYAYDVLFDQERGGIAVRPNGSGRNVVRSD